MSEFLFADEAEESPAESAQQNRFWKLLIVDDEPEVHTVTKLALGDFTFQGGELQFLSAYSGEEARKMIVEHPDVAVVLLDVVMESDDAGLQVVRFIRETARNFLTRIILRTGQPGQAPERTVIVDYDINDYKSKTELTSQKLFTVVMSSLRSYRDLTSLEHNRAGLETILKASSDLFAFKNLDSFVQGVLQQLSSIFSTGDEAFTLNSLVAEFHQRDGCDKDLRIVAAQGDFEGAEGKLLWNVLPEGLETHCHLAIDENTIVYGDGYMFSYRHNAERGAALVFMSGIPVQLGETDRKLIELFSNNVQVAYDNLLLKQEIEDTQREIVYRLGEAVETRSRETGNHLKRVAFFSERLAQLSGMTTNEATIVKLASPLHDVGKIGIPDAILNKPGKLDPHEWEVMKTHAQLGYDILQDSNRSIIRAGAAIALEHHERWDGSGYPNGQQGEDIHIYGRIVALADVFDALANSRCYKEAWPLEKCFDLIEEESGKHLDPSLVKLFLDNRNDFIAILNRYPS